MGEFTRPLDTTPTLTRLYFAHLSIMRHTLEFL